MVLNDPSTAIAEFGEKLGTETSELAVDHPSNLQLRFLTFSQFIQQRFLTVIV